ncbi:ssDNA endonuclease and repair protein rad10 [Naganishia albida]|nr:ssDNA endonuclease and repair protein rad10 [Naganishia albida]
MPLPTAPGFTPASSLPRPAEETPMQPPITVPTTAASNRISSNRNASNAHLPVPSAPPITLDADGAQIPSSTAASVGRDGQAAPKPGTNVNGVESGAAAAQGKTNKPVNVPSGSKRSIVVNARQRGNPVLKAIQGVGWEYGDIVPDYQVGANTCVLYLSLKYHRLHPEYLHTRIEAIRGTYLLRILLLMCDISEHQEPIREITKICLINEITVITAWSAEEAATYLATYKAFEHKPPDMLKERVHKNYASQLQSVLTSVKGVNKTDVLTLGTNFGSFKNMAHATPEQLALCPGLGEVKVRRLYDAFNLPFKVGAGGQSRKRSKANAATKTNGAKDAPTTTPSGKITRVPSSGSGRTEEQLTLSDVGLSMGLDAEDEDGSQTKKRKRPEDEVVILDDDEEDVATAAPAVEGSPDWPDIASDEDDPAGETGKKVWKDPLAMSDDSD